MAMKTVWTSCCGGNGLAVTAPGFIHHQVHTAALLPTDQPWTMAGALGQSFPRKLSHRDFGDLMIFEDSPLARSKLYLTDIILTQSYLSLSPASLCEHFPASFPSFTSIWRTAELSVSTLQLCPNTCVKELDQTLA